MPAQVHHSKIAGTSWSPAQYLRFGGHRLRPALELLDRMPLPRLPSSLTWDAGRGR